MFLLSAVVANAYDSRQRFKTQTSGVRNEHSLASIDATGSVASIISPRGAAVIRKSKPASVEDSRHTFASPSARTSDQSSSATAVIEMASSAASIVAAASVKSTSPPLADGEMVSDYGPPETTLSLLAKANLGTLLPIILGISFVFVVLVIIAISFMCLDHKGLTQDEEPLHCKPDPIDLDFKDMYGLAVSAVVRDMRSCVVSHKTAAVRVGALAVTMLTLMTVLGLQIFMLQSAETLVAASAVGSIRQLYDRYEVGMYGNNRSRMVRTSNNYYRGREEFFDADNFRLISADEKKQICQIPLSQPTFFTTLISVWSFTVISDIRKGLDLMLRMLYCTPTITSLADALQLPHLYEEPVDRRAQIGSGPTGDQVCVIAGLTVWAKGVLLTFVFVPRFIVDLWLLDLGSLWLTATPNFHELVFNTVALEFILSMNVIVFHTMVPRQSTMDMKNTRILPPLAKIHVTPWNGLAAFAWGILALGYAITYVYIMQPVLPQYRWDVGSVCTPYLLKTLEKAQLTAT